MLSAALRSLIQIGASGMNEGPTLRHFHGVLEHPLDGACGAPPPACNVDYADG